MRVDENVQFSSDLSLVVECGLEPLLEGEEILPHLFVAVRRTGASLYPCERGYLGR